MIPAVTIATDPGWTVTFKINARHIIEHQRHPVREALRIELFFQRYPAAVEFIHRRIKVVLVEVLAGLVQPTGRGQKRAPGVIDQSQLSAGKEDAAKDHGLE